MMSLPLDPAQLVALDALLAERHVTRAAARLGITQSSMSHRLKLLRRALGDPLVVRVGATLAPTPRAAAMAAPLAAALRALAAAVAPPTTFDPARTQASLTIALPDLLAPLAPRLVAGLTGPAPGLRVRLVTIEPALTAALAGDAPMLALTPVRFVSPEVQARPLGELRFAVAGRRGHPALRRRLDVSGWLAHGHVVVRTGNEATNLVADAVAARGLVRRVGLEVPTFLAGLLVVASSDLLMNVPVPLVDQAAAALGLRVRDAPIALPRVRFAMAWHPRYQHDPAHQWARAVLDAAIRPAFGGAAVSSRSPRSPDRTGPRTTPR